MIFKDQMNKRPLTRANPINCPMVSILILSPRTIKQTSTCTTQVQNRLIPFNSFNRWTRTIVRLIPKMVEFLFTLAFDSAIIVAQVTHTQSGQTTQFVIFMNKCVYYAYSFIHRRHIFGVLCSHWSSVLCSQHSNGMEDRAAHEEKTNKKFEPDFNWSSMFLLLLFCRNKRSAKI